MKPTTKRGRGRPKTEPTVQIRAYAADVAKLAKQGTTQAEAVRALLTKKRGGQSRCADCGGPIGKTGPKDGWQLDDGRTVCQPCCVRDLQRIAKKGTK